jgi:soluble lytic murein transglycosylase-like protein
LTPRQQLILAAAWLVATAVAAVEPMGPCRVRLRSGRTIDAASLRPVDADSSFRKLELGGGGSVVLPVRELKSAEALAATPPPAEEVSVALPPAADVETASCDPLTDAQLRRWDELAARTARKYDLDEALVRAVIAVESCGDPGAVSPKGAVGLMQLMPKTAKDYGCADPTDPEANVDAGCRHLARLSDKLGDLALVVAAYNAGEGAVEKAGGVPRFRETQAYVRDVVRHVTRLKAAQQPSS